MGDVRYYDVGPSREDIKIRKHTLAVSCEPYISVNNMHTNSNDLGYLRSRWSPQQIEEISRLLAAGRTDEIAVPTVNIGGVLMQDLRGITIVEPIERVRLHRIDLSYCTTELPGSIVTALEECRFIGADLRKTNIGNHAVRCDWSRAKFHVLYGIYEDCSFIETDFSGAKGGALRFCEMRFHGRELEEGGYHTKYV